MKRYIQFLVFVMLISACSDLASQTNSIIPNDGPIQLHPENPHYFLYQGKTLALITSAEHYGAVLNLDFDYKTYLNTLAEDGMNYTRIFTGSYFEIYGESFGIQKNTLAPQKERVITPWLKLDPQEVDGVKYDLTQWNSAYFTRLKDFMSLAAEKDIIVEVTLFSSIYRDEHWDLSPQNPDNNINIDHPVNRFDGQTLENGDLLQYQESFVRKMVQELNEFDNFFFEIQNEPWSDHALPVYNIVNKEELRTNDWTYKADFADEKSMKWQERIATVIVDKESMMANKHLIAQNYTNFRASVPKVNANISIINFHYAWPEAVEWNYHYDKVIGFDESGFAGSGDQVYRRQAWQFMLSGGGLFNNLDYSFFVGHEDGLGQNNAPGGGSKALRQQLKTLSEFLHSFKLEEMYPAYMCIESSPGLIPYILSDGKGSFAIFLRATGTRESTLKLKTDNGTYSLETLDPISGEYRESSTLQAKEGIISMEVEIPDGELALKIVKE